MDQTSASILSIGIKYSTHDLIRDVIKKSRQSIWRGSSFGSLDGVWVGGERRWTARPCTGGPISWRQRRKTWRQWV